jgi:hypothetical protein
MFVSVDFAHHRAHAGGDWHNRLPGAGSAAPAQRGAAAGQRETLSTSGFTAACGAWQAMQL